MNSNFEPIPRKEFITWKNLEVTKKFLDYLEYKKDLALERWLKTNYENIETEGSLSLQSKTLLQLFQQVEAEIKYGAGWVESPKEEIEFTSENRND